jgi:hypothetical protein
MPRERTQSKWSTPAFLALSCLLFLAACRTSLDVSVALSPPSIVSPAISGPLTISKGSPTAAFAETFPGNPSTYQWYMDGSAISGATSSGVSVNVTNPALSVGSHLLSIVILDASGVQYSGSMRFQVTP